MDSNNRGSEDLSTLLDYVYCNTEPMRNAQFRQPLDFNGIVRGLRNSETDTLELQSNEVQRIKKLITEQGIYAEKPAIYRASDSKNKLGGDEAKIPNIVGKAKFSDTTNINPFGGRD